MLLLKATAVLLFTVACYADTIETPKTDPKDSYAHQPNVAPEPAKNGSTTVVPTTSTTTPNPSTQNPNTTTTTTSTTPKPSTTTSTTPKPSTTTSNPNTTTTTPKPTTTTQKPTPTPSPSPNSTTTVPPEPAQPRKWDGPSFLGGMVLAFGIVAVGFVGYRFFYLGRGGAYHTL